MIYGLLKQFKISQKSSKRILNVKSSGDKISENLMKRKKVMNWLRPDHEMTFQESEFDRSEKS